MTVQVRRTGHTDRQTGKKFPFGEQMIVSRKRGLDLIASGIVSLVSDDDILPCGTWLYDAYNGKKAETPAPKAPIRKPKSTDGE